MGAHRGVVEGGVALLLGLHLLQAEELLALQLVQLALLPTGRVVSRRLACACGRCLRLTMGSSLTHLSILPHGLCRTAQAMHDGRA